jgi:hypothetical protein
LVRVADISFTLLSQPPASVRAAMIAITPFIVPLLPQVRPLWACHL